MGLGKTLQAIAWAEALLKTGHARTVVVVCPAALKSQWRQEWQRFAGRDPVIVDGLKETDEVLSDAARCFDHEL